ncbi:MAG TPA: RagB/SusD family nutrient uptake outer membrane protein, partial [Flavisolibacter sp.]|nr:RagB/SusD family nutrient uptake outer membrane protein [Flavisolibacter sp.]
MKYKLLNITILAGLLLLGSCKKVLDYTPTGVLSSNDLQSPTAVEGLVTAAYAGIGNGDMIGPIYSKWAFGSVRSDDAYKGGGGTGDVGEIDAMEHYNLVTPSMDAFVSRTWKNLFKSISRANVAMRAVNGISDASFPNKKTRLGELHFLRAHS